MSTEARPGTFHRDASSKVACDACGVSLIPPFSEHDRYVRAWMVQHLREHEVVVEDVPLV